MALEASRDRKKRYDRQLRLWGEHGQDALEGANICLLYATAVGTETLKNLVLPGVSHLTVVDPFQVTKRDLGKNFFVDLESVGKSRAQTCAVLLNELNELVKVESVVENPVDLIEKKPEFFKAFTHVILAQDIPTASLLKLDTICSQNRSPLFVVRAYGYVGALRVVTQEHRIYETKPDHFKADVRVNQPFPALQKFADDFVIPADMDSHDYSHIPWIVFTLRDLKAWREAHGGQAPSNRAEQTEFQKILRAHHRTSDEENVAQAVENAHYAWVPVKISSDINQIFKDPKTEIDASSRPFWIVARAVKDFVANEGQGMLPLSGNIPDMVSDTKSFVTIQRLFKDKALEDIASVTKRVHDLLKSIGRAENTITDEYIALACKNAAFWKLMRFRTINQEFATPNQSAIGNALTFLKENDGKCAPIYVFLRAVDRFNDQHGRYPGLDESVLETDQAEVKRIAEEILAEFGQDADSVETETYAAEFARYGGAEIHNIASFMGGVAAQEVIKIVTEQLVPINNTFIFNGINSTTSVYEL